MTACSLNSRAPENLNFMPESSHYSKGKFHNTSGETTSFEFGKIYQFLVNSIKSRNVEKVPKGKVPVVPMRTEDILSTSDDTIWRIGHSTLLLKLSNQLVLLDPVFSERASPFSMIGPKRFHKTPIDIEHLPEIDAVVISHNHYDHLDKASIKQLTNKVKRFIVPLGNANDLMAWGVDSSKISEVDWWQTTQIGDLEIIATPSQHFSGRGITDKDKTLWASYVIRSQESNIHFSGDTGYFKGFKEIGDKYGPFDMTLVETGAYHPDWAEIHMLPEQSLQAHIDLKGKRMMPIHNGTFSLALHSWKDPFDQISKLSEQHNVALLTPKMGEALTINGREETLSWWKSI